MGSYPLAAHEFQGKGPSWGMRSIARTFTFRNCEDDRVRPIGDLACKMIDQLSKGPVAEEDFEMIRFPL